ncbi:MAG: HDOD domain-containing protein [Leptospirales bacterium]|nr:HDOD domain-containing protein [Leptospirales bacterium]
MIERTAISTFLVFMAIDFKKTQLGIQPQVLTGLVSLDSNSNVNFSELDRLVSADQNISALVMKAANSSFYSRGIPIARLQQAIGRLGFNVVRSMAIVASSQQMFEQARYARFRRYVSEHCMVTALIARQLAVKLGRKDLAEEAFVAGLLHDIAKVVMNAHDRQKFIATLDIIEKEQASGVEAERQIFGFDHHQVGAMIVDEWKLPHLFKAALSEHEGQPQLHRPDREERELAILSLVGYANAIAHKIGYGGGENEPDADLQLFSAELKAPAELQAYYLSDAVRSDLQNDDQFKFYMSLV